MEALVKTSRDFTAIRVQVPHRGLPANLPFLSNGMWDITIDLDSGYINDWPGGGFHVILKVVDMGTYTLIDEWGKHTEFGNVSVPNRLLPGDFGAYLNLIISGKGKITNWPSDANLDDFFGGS